MDALESSGKSEESQPRVAGIDSGRLRSFVERIQNLDNEVAEITKQVAEVYDEASAEFDKKALKLVVARMRKTRSEVDALDFLVIEYERALGCGDRGEPPEHLTVAELQVRASASAHARTREGDAGAPLSRAQIEASPSYKEGYQDGLADSRDHAGNWPDGKEGSAWYSWGFDDGRTERIDREEADTPPPAESASRARARRKTGERVGA